MGNQLSGNGSGQNPQHECKCLFQWLIHCMGLRNTAHPHPQARTHCCVFRAPREGVVMVDGDVVDTGLGTKFSGHMIFYHMTNGLYKQLQVQNSTLSTIFTVAHHCNHYQTWNRPNKCEGCGPTTTEKGPAMQTMTGRLRVRDGLLSPSL